MEKLNYVGFLCVCVYVCIGVYVGAVCVFVCVELN